MDNLVEVKDIAKTYKSLDGVFGMEKPVVAVNGVNLQIKKGESLGLVGESGCGKTTVGKIILGLEKPDAGTVHFENKKISGLSSKEMFSTRKYMQIIFQDPFASLNPRIRIGSAIGEVLTVYGVKDTEKLVKQMIEIIGLPEDTYYRYPHEFSGGQRQRICIARALVGNPKFVVCDEPVSSLDVSVQAQIINLLKELKEELHLTYLFISHDLRVVKNICDRITVMYYGKIIEEGDTDIIYTEPLHPYTELLISAVPSMIMKNGVRRKRNAVSSVSAINGEGCPFFYRCPKRIEKCGTITPVLKDLGNNRKVACWNV
ncbi:MAG: ATP-binding cassette domain-containing protein [Candidatus Firestonebacteria bacterium]|nr:ATP-binding cassette domain-containing protein [Candidatus Firestonebacteria bacterium]